MKRNVYKETIYLMIASVFVGLLLVLACSMVQANPVHASKLVVDPDVEKIERYIHDYLGEAYINSTRWNNARDMSESIVEAAEWANVDPLLLAVVIKHESGFRVLGGEGITGKLGERGLGQLHGVAARHARKKGLNLRTVLGQLRGAGMWLRRCLDQCGDVEGGLRAYQTGKCMNVKVKGARLRYRAYRSLL